MKKSHIHLIEANLRKKMLALRLIELIAKTLKETFSMSPVMSTSELYLGFNKKKKHHK